MSKICVKITTRSCGLVGSCLVCHGGRTWMPTRHNRCSPCCRELTLAPRTTGHSRLLDLIVRFEALAFKWWGKKCISPKAFACRLYLVSLSLVPVYCMINIIHCDLKWLEKKHEQHMSSLGFRPLWQKWPRHLSDRPPPPGAFLGKGHQGGPKDGSNQARPSSLQEWPGKHCEPPGTPVSANPEPPNPLGHSPHLRKRKKNN